MTFVIPIGVSTQIAVHGWTFANFLTYVQYEAMFFDTCKRTEPRTEDVACTYVMTRTGPGHNGFPTDVTQRMVLFNPDGNVPEFDPIAADLAHNGDAAIKERRARYAGSAE